MLHFAVKMPKNHQLPELKLSNYHTMLLNIK